MLGSGGTTTEVAGAWTLDVRGITLPTGATAVKATSSNGTVATSVLTFK